MNKLRKDQGLSLAELIIALSVSALVMVLLGQGLSNISNWSGKLTSAQSHSDETASLFRFLNERLIRVEPLSIAGKDETRILFEGYSNKVVMVIAESAYPAKPGLYEQSIELVPDKQNNWQILLRRKPLLRLDEFAQNDAGAPLLLYSGPQQPKFSYLGENGWLEDWQSFDQMPLSIGFELEGWPKIQIPLAPALVPWSYEPGGSTSQEPKSDDG